MPPTGWKRRRGVRPSVELPRDQILLGDCLELLKSLPDSSIEACVTDPPYGLGNKEPGADELFMFVLGGTLDMGGDFMGRDWELPSVAVWREIYRVLKPGGHVIAFGGTRTFDLISFGLRMAGFESRDTIAREFPILQWIQGQGMPKSHNVSVAIDKKLGKKRPVVGTRPIAYPDSPSGYTSVSANSTARGNRFCFGETDETSGEVGHGRPVTAAVSDEAKQWEGWGSGLKPAWEPILVFRKPLKGTLASNVLEHGTGALNIDATRVRHASKEDFEAHKKGVDAIREKGGSRDKSWKNSSDLSGANEVTASGRWPSNCLLEHSPLCTKVGTKKIRGSHAVVAKGESFEGKTLLSENKHVFGAYSKEKPLMSHVGLDGLEETEAWECAEGCPVKALDDQSGERPSTLTGRADPNDSHQHPGTVMRPNSAFLGERSHLSKVYADNGGAARFFTQLGPDEVEGGVGRFFSQFEAEGGVPFRYVPKANRKEAGCGEFEVEHITVKPLELMRWLVRLVTPKGGRVLDPYAGSGSTCHAAVLEGMHYIGIERDEKNHAEATRRLGIVHERERERLESEAVFDFAMGGSGSAEDELHEVL